MRSSQRAFNKIVEYEVSNEAVYTRKYQRPEWPGVQSGPTVGIGYDLGQTPAETIMADWKGRVPDDMLAVMVSVSGKTGAAGKAATNRIYGLVLIPWETAITVHKNCVIPRWEERLMKALPNAEKLPGDCFGALLSLIFNRGTSFQSNGDRYSEMRAIRAAMIAEDYKKIPGLLRSMKRLWPNVQGLINRREDEARLFEAGLKGYSPELKEPVPLPEARPARPDPVNMGDHDDKTVVQPEIKPLTKSKTMWGGITGWLSGVGSAFFGLFEKLDNPYTLAAFIVIVLFISVAAYLVIKGRIDVNKVVKQLAQDDDA